MFAKLAWKWKTNYSYTASFPKSFILIILRHGVVVTIFFCRTSWYSQSKWRLTPTGEPGTVISSHKVNHQWLTLITQIIFLVGHKCIRHMLQGITGWRSKSPKSLQEGNPVEGRTRRLYQHPGSSHTGIPVMFPGRQPQLEKAASLSGVPRGEKKQEKTSSQQLLQEENS